MRTLGRLLSCLLALAAIPAQAEPPLLIRAQALDKLTHRVVIIDAREPDQYEQGHIEGAISLPWVDLAQMPKSAVLRDARTLGDLFTSRGISSSRPVVVYGSGAAGLGEEGRVFWTMAYLGHSMLRVLDGGLPAWKKAGLPLTTEGPDLPTGVFKPSPVESYRVGKAALQIAIKASTIDVLDVRDADEFKGAVKYGEARGGHIPGAHNLPWKQLLNEDGAFLPKEEIRKRLAAAGVRLDKPVVVYCTVGVRSGFAFLGLRVAGVTKVANYDGSFLEWAGEASLPVETAP